MTRPGLHQFYLGDFLIVVNASCWLLDGLGLRTHSFKDKRSAMSETNLSVWVGDTSVCIRIAGRASFTCSVDFKKLVNGLREKGYHHFVLDLTQCPLMDSTFLGILANLGSQLSQDPARPRCAGIELLNPNPRITDMLENLGVSQFFSVTSGTSPGADRLMAFETSPGLPDKKEFSRHCLEAHQFLMDCHPSNISKFKEVTRFLQEDLNRLEGKSEG